MNRTLYFLPICHIFFCEGWCSKRYTVNALQAYTTDIVISRVHNISILWTLGDILLQAKIACICFYVQWCNNNLQYAHHMVWILFVLASNRAVTLYMSYFTADKLGGWIYLLLNVDWDRDENYWTGSKN